MTLRDAYRALARIACDESRLESLESWLDCVHPSWHTSDEQMADDELLKWSEHLDPNKRFLRKDKW